MNAALVDQVRDFLRGARSKVTAKLIADEIGAAPLDVGKALDELQGLHHAARDGLNRWHITEKGRIGGSTPPSHVAKTATPGTIIRRILDALGDEARTDEEIAVRTGLDRKNVQVNLHGSKETYGLVKDGERNGRPLWRRRRNGEPEDMRPAIKKGTSVEIDRAAVAAQQDREEAKGATETRDHANTTQVGGDHYRQRAIQPWDYIAANDLGFFEGNVVKYVTRWRDKGGIDDLLKARHYLDKLIEMKQGNRA